MNVTKKRKHQVKVDKKSTSGAIKPKPEISAWFAVGTVYWERGRIRCEMIKKATYGRFDYNTRIMLPSPDYSGETTDDVRAAMRWTSRQAAHQWKTSGYGSARGRGDGHHVLNLKELGLEAEDLGELDEKSTPAG